MTTSRTSQVHVETTPYYHCISRCVRRAYLCGRDDYSGKSFDHRKEWLVERLRQLSSVFAIDVCAYAVMSNHFHLVLRVDRERAEGWSEEDVVKHYGRLFRGAREQLELLTKSARAERVALWRARLGDLSWMMRTLNEHIARRANKEDGCAGRFWEGRFKSQALLDEVGLLTCMAYVDLNPVRAGMAKSLASSEFTSIQDRLRVAAEQLSARKGARTRSKAPRGLMPFVGQARGEQASLPSLLADYVALLEWTGRAVRADKRGKLDGATPAILERLSVDADAWIRAMSTGTLRRMAMVGSAETMQAEVERRGQQHAKGQRWARTLTRVAA